MCCGMKWYYENKWNGFDRIVQNPTNTFKQHARNGILWFKYAMMSETRSLALKIALLYS